MRNISDTTASWLVVLGLVTALGLTSFWPMPGARSDVQEPAVQRLSRAASETAAAAANARVPRTNVIPTEELWWTPSEEWNFLDPLAASSATLAQAEPLIRKVAEPVASTPKTTWFCNLFRTRSPAT